MERTAAAEVAQLELAKNTEASIKERIDSGKENMLAREGTETDYGKLRSQLLQDQAFLARLTGRENELEVQSRTHLSNVRVVDAALPNYVAVRPSMLFNLGVALVVGLLGGVSLARLREYLYDTISGPLDVTTYLRVPYLGLIPKLSEVTGPTGVALFTHFNPKSSTSEAVRSLRTILEMSPTGKSLKRLLVTSSVSSEGKTSTTVRLGISFANLGKRVLIIDADLRRPSIHKVFECQRDSGLTSVLAGMPYEAAIRSTVVPGLEFMTAGHSVERPNELLASQDFAMLLAELDRRYDIILIDTPPVLLSDAVVLSKSVDGVVLVVRENTVSRQLVKESVMRLTQVGAPLLGVVINAVDTMASGANYKYYGYRYRDYYTYTDEPSPPTDKDAAAK